MNMISLYMDYCKLHFLFIFVHVDLEINLIDIISIHFTTLIRSHFKIVLLYVKKEIINLTKTNFL